MDAGLGPSWKCLSTAAFTLQRRSSQLSAITEIFAIALGCVAAEVFVGYIKLNFAHDWQIHVSPCSGVECRAVFGAGYNV